MRIPARPRTRLAFNITPLIDIVFNIMIFFLVTAHFVRSQETDLVDLPSATQVAEADAAPRRLVVTILADRTLRVAGRDVELEEAQSLIVSGAERPDEFEVQIRTDQDVPYSVIEPLLLACAENGITNFGFKVFEARP
jgi:biopolymer transport protein ExbD